MGDHQRFEELNLNSIILIEDRVDELPMGAQEDVEIGLIQRSVMRPWTFLFSLMPPNPESSLVRQHIFVGFMVPLMFCQIPLTFFLVDCSEKIGKCFSIPGNLLDISLLSVASSLPACFSSVIVARQSKMDMALANAFGSSVFEVNLSVGLSFVLGYLLNLFKPNTSILPDADAETAVFSHLILAPAVCLVVMWLMMWVTLGRLQKWMGYILIFIYIVFLCVLSVEITL